MTSFKFTSREVIGVLKRRILNLTQQINKMTRAAAAREAEMRECIQSQAAKIVNLQTELREKNGIIQRNQGGTVMPQMSNITLALQLAERLNGFKLLHPLSFREQVRAVCPQAVGDDLNQLADNTAPWVVPVASYGVGESVPQMPTQGRAFSMSEICKVFSVKPEQVVSLAKTIMHVSRAGSSNVVIGSIAPEVLSGARYGEFVSVGGFPEGTVPAAGQHGYTQHAYYINKAEADTLNSPTSGQIYLANPNSVDVVNNPKDADTMVPVIITVLR